MADKTNGASKPSDDQNASEEVAGPVGLRVLGQYLKDLSFESPGAPASLRAGDQQLGLNVNVAARPMKDNRFEVELKLEANSTREDKPLFVVELTYAGLFELTNVPAEQVQPVILIECPRLLFPFARQIVADATRQGGFPPLMIDPIDFVRLYNQRMSELQAQRMASEASESKAG